MTEPIHTEQANTNPSPKDAGETDQERIRSCLARYCRGIDRRNRELVCSAYWPGAIDDHVVFVGPVEKYVEWVMSLLERLELTQHNLGHSYFEMHGAVAMVETCFTAYHRVPIEDGAHDIMLGARYVDRMEKRAHEWRIGHRMLIQDWMHDLGPSHDWAQGSLGMRNLHDHGVGHPVTDASVQFFRSLGGSR